MPAGDGSWEPSVSLHNPTEEAAQAAGWPVAVAELQRPDGTVVRSRQREWPMPAVLITYRLAPEESRRLRVSLSLLADEKAALPPGRYRVTNARWGQLRAPDVDLDITAP